METHQTVSRTNRAKIRTLPPAAPSRWRLLVPALWWAVILCLSSIPQARFAPFALPAWTSVIAHFVEYGVLGATLRWALPRSIRRPVLTTVLVGLALGVLDELWQSAVPGRHPSVVDLAVDLVALALAAGLTPPVASRVLRRG